MEEISSLIYQDVPQNKLSGKNLTVWSGTDIWVAVIIFLSLIVAWFWLNPLATIFLSFLLGPLLLRFRKSNGRLYYEIYGGLRGVFRQTVLGGIWWQADDKSSAIIKWLRYKKFSFGRAHVIPLRLGEVQAVIQGKLERVSLIHELDQPYDHMYIYAQGANIASMDVDQMHFAVKELAEVTNRVILQTDLNAGISYVRINGPLNPTKLLRFFRTNMNPVLVKTSQFKLDQDTLEWVNWMQQDARELIPTAQAFGAADGWSLIVISIKRTGQWKRASQGKLSDEELYDLPIVELGREMVSALQGSARLGLTDVHCLSLPELAMVVRTAWDVVGIEGYYSDCAAGKIPLTDQQVDAIREKYGDAGVDRALRAWPEKRIETTSGNDMLVLDDNYISTLRVTEIPKQLREDEFLSLHYIPKAGQWSRLTLVGRAVSGDAEARNLVIGHSALLNFQDAFFRNRIIQPIKLRKKSKELASQTEVIGAKSIAQHFNIIVPSIGHTPYATRATRKVLKTGLSAKGFISEPITGEDIQLNAFISGALGISRF